MHRYTICVVAILCSISTALAQNAIQQRQETLRAAEYAYELAIDSRSTTDTELARATYDYGLTLLHAYDAAKSRKILKLALKRYVKAFGEDSPKLTDVLLAMAQADALLQRSLASKNHLEKARAVVAGSLDDTSLEYADHVFRIGRVAFALSFTDDAFDDLIVAHEIYSTSLEPRSIRQGEANAILGELSLQDGKLDEAETFFQSALGIFDPSDPLLFDRHIQVLAAWGGGLDVIGMRDEATLHYLEIGRLQEPLATDPLPMLRAAPQYPRDALKNGVSGFVEWQFTVDERGFVVDPKVVKLQGAPSFEEASLKALMQFRYPPRFVDGEPVATPGVTSTISFTLGN